jgi:hypothetical protein
VGELALTIGAWAPQPSAGLAGETLFLDFDDGSRGEARFRPDGTLDWSEDKLPAWSAPCRVVELRPGLFMADMIDASRIAATRTLIIDRARGSALEIQVAMPDSREVAIPLFKRAQSGRRLTAVALRQRRAGLGNPFPPTTELVGRAKTYRYSATDIYQHIYVSADRYSWQCLSGSEKGLADTDETIHLRLAEDLVLFIWLEKIIPTCGMVAIDLAAGRSSGKIFGYASAELTQLTNVAVGAEIIEAPIGLTA